MSVDEVKEVLFIVSGQAPGPGGLRHSHILRQGRAASGKPAHCYRQRTWLTGSSEEAFHCSEFTDGSLRETLLHMINSCVVMEY